MTRRRWFAIGVALAVMAGCSTTAAVLTRADGTASAQAANPVLSSPTTTEVTDPPTTTATTTPPPLPVPDAPPDDPYADVPVAEIGAISIPKLGLQHAIYEGIWLTVLNVGPGHWPNSAMPGQRGNTVFPGHRSTFSQPFHDVDRLVAGDEVIFQMPDADHVYRVRETIIVKPTDMWVVDQTEAPTFTLVACHPKGSAAERIVIKGDLVASTVKAGSS